MNQVSDTSLCGQCEVGADSQLAQLSLAKRKKWEQEQLAGLLPEEPASLKIKTHYIQFV